MHFSSPILAALLALTGAKAADDPLANLYSNTLISTSPTQVVSRVFINKDGTWSSTTSDSEHPRFNGMWARMGSWLCTTNAAMPDTQPRCRKEISHRMGEEWTDVLPDRTVMHIKLVAGR